MLVPGAARDDDGILGPTAVSRHRGSPAAARSHRAETGIYSDPANSNGSVGRMQIKKRSRPRLSNNAGVVDDDDWLRAAVR